MANKFNHNVEQFTVVTVNSMCLTKKLQHRLVSYTVPVTIT